MSQVTSNKVLIAGVGHDQPGIVAAVTNVLSTHGCNIEDTAMTQLGSSEHRAFSWMLIASLPNDSTSIEQLQSALTDAGRPLGLTFFVSPYHEGDASGVTTEEDSSPYLITVAGLDHTGITHDVAKVLEEQTINITDLHAKRIPGEGGLVYMLLIEIELTSVNTQVLALETALKHVAQSAGVEISMRPIETALHL